jgi:hypothetical protein
MIRPGVRVKIDYDQPGAARPREQRWTGRTGTVSGRLPDGAWLVRLDKVGWEEDEREVCVSGSCLVGIPANLVVYPERPVEVGPVGFAPCSLSGDK